MLWDKSLLNFFKRDRLYIWMVLFILFVNLTTFIPHPKQIPKDDSITSKTFKELSLNEETVKKVLEKNTFLSKLARLIFSIGLGLLFLGLLLNLRFLTRGGKSPSLVQKSSLEIKWNILDVFRVSVSLIFCGYIVYFFELLLIRYFDFFKMDMNLRLILNTTIMDLIGIFIIFYFVFIKYKQRPMDLGLTLKNFIKNIFVGFVSYVALIPTLLMILLVVLWVLNLIKYEPPPQPIFELLFEEKRSNLILFLGVFISFFGPIIEEIFFRGFLYNAIKRQFGIKSGVVISAILFSLLHSNLVGFLPIMALGVLMAYLYEATGSLVSSITVHTIHNTLILGFVFFIKALLGIG